MPSTVTASVCETSLQMKGYGWLMKRDYEGIFLPPLLLYWSGVGHSPTGKRRKNQGKFE
jgi:hypothetical protein